MTDTLDRLTPTQLLENAWRLTPDALGERISGGSYVRYRHIRHVSSIVARTIAQGNGRLILSMPPQEGKSELIGHWTPVWFLHMTGGRGRVLYASYADSLATRAGRKTRATIREHGDELGVWLSPDATRTDEWETTTGGGMWCAGVGGSMTGRSGDLIIIDDPHKNWVEAQSAAKKAEVWDFYSSVMRIRASEGATIIVLHTRWVPDDLAGRLETHTLAGTGEPFTTIRLPALADPIPPSEENPEGEPDPIGRAAGEPLSPLHSLDSILGVKATQSRMQWSGLMQQRPTVAEGDTFARTDWEKADELPSLPIVSAAGGKRGLLLERRWDLASTKKETGNDPDWTVGVLMGLDEFTMTPYVIDVIRFRERSAKTRKLILETAEADAEAWGGNDKVLIRGEQEPGSSGKTVAEDYQADLAAYPVKWTPSTGSKEVRADPWAGVQQNHRAFLLRRESADGRYVPQRWWDDFIEEHADFPNGLHDDQVDAASAVYNDLAEIARKRRKNKARVTSVAGRQLGGGGLGPGGGFGSIL